MNVTPELLFAVFISATALLVVWLFLYRKLPKRIKRRTFTQKWRVLQSQCASIENWSEVIIQADALLDEVLKKKKKNGKTMGERLVSAQKDFTNNDAVWQAHKLAAHVQHTAKAKLKENDVKDALVAFRQAMRDLGAL